MKIRFAGSGDALGSGGRRQTCIHVSGQGQVLAAVRSAPGGRAARDQSPADRSAGSPTQAGLPLTTALPSIWHRSFNQHLVAGAEAS